MSRAADASCAGDPAPRRRCDRPGRLMVARRLAPGRPARPRPAGGTRARPAGGLGRGVALRGTVWPGGGADPYDGVVLVAADGPIDRIGPPGRCRSRSACG